MAMTNFRASDMPGAKKIAYAAGSKPKGSKDNGAGVPENSDPNAVPEGTAAEVMAWVGDDADKAQRALDAENAATKPRTTLIEDLERAIVRDEDDEPQS